MSMQPFYTKEKYDTKREAIKEAKQIRITHYARVRKSGKKWAVLQGGKHYRNSKSK